MMEKDYSNRKTNKLGKVGEDIALTKLQNNEFISKIDDVRYNEDYQNIDVDFVIYGHKKKISCHRSITEKCIILSIIISNFVEISFTSACLLAFVTLIYFIPNVWVKRKHRRTYLWKKRQQ